MAIRIEVLDARCDEKSGEKNGRSYTIRKQAAYAYIPDEFGKLPKYPTLIYVDLGRDGPPYQPGIYALDPRSFFVGDYGTLKVGRLKLAPLPK